MSFVVFIFRERKMVTRERRKFANNNNNEIEERPCCSCWEIIPAITEVPLLNEKNYSRFSFRKIRIPSPIALFITFFICGIFNITESSPQQWEQGSGPNTTYISQVRNFRVKIKFELFWIFHARTIFEISTFAKTKFLYFRY